MPSPESVRITTFHSTAMMPFSISHSAKSVVIERDTRLQSNCPLWHKLRQHRITASVVADVSQKGRKSCSSIEGMLTAAGSSSAVAGSVSVVVGSASAVAGSESAVAGSASTLHYIQSVFDMRG
ncbi:hypothetical protein C0Q70_03445 [Pomacea canaliculata]|uniref:Uncharacterized protein n=1 Tax=Pomacea canaliculata TaxID=400727 RepID=A0A2T7PSR0_POMCA|nr:hypothetical protein C0Q70_03445 [Pomacea canaliculata]